MSTITYIVKVASSKFEIDGASAPKLTFRDGDTYVFDQADASNSGHILQFSATSNNSGSSEYTTGVTKTGTPGNAGAKTTIVTSGSTTDTLYFYSSGGGTYGEEFSNSGFNTSTTYNFLKPIVGAEATSEKWGPMINHALDQIDQGIDAAITAQDLDFQGDSGGALNIDLDSETLDIAGGTGLSTVGSSNTITVNLDDTAVTAGLYGSASQIPAITVDAQGRITSASTNAISSSFSLTGDSGSDSFAVGGTLNLLGGTGITSAVTDDTVTFAIDSTVATLIGSQALTNKTINGTAVGEGGGAWNTRNVWLGTTILSGQSNVAIGQYSLDNASVGNSNTAVGTKAMTSSGSGDGNTAIGMHASGAISDGDYNCSLGYMSLYRVNDGDKNIGIGWEAGENITTGNRNIMIGNAIDADSATGDDQLNIGGVIKGNLSTLAVTFTGAITAGSFNAQQIATFPAAATGNTGFGTNALNSVTTGTDNVGIGYNALTTVTTQHRNMAIGFGALRFNTADDNVAIGSQALTTNTSGTGNFGFGKNTLMNNSTGSYNVGLGQGVLMNSTATGNTAIGSGAGQNITSGSDNICIGRNVYADSATGSNQLNIGDTIYGDLLNGNVGIGTAPSARILEIGSSFGMVRTGTGAGNFTTYISHAGSSTYGSIYYDVTAATGGYRWQTDGTERMVIDSSGRVTKPYQPSASVYINSMNAGAYNSSPTNPFVIATGVRHNTGNHYSTSNGRFTCPVDGKYLVMFSSNWYSGGTSPGSWHMPKIYVNEGVKHQFYDMVDVAWQQISGTAIIDCSENDYIRLRYVSASGAGGGGDTSEYSNISFTLLN